MKKYALAVLWLTALLGCGMCALLPGEKKQRT